MAFDINSAQEENTFQAKNGVHIQDTDPKGGFDMNSAQEETPTIQGSVQKTGFPALLDSASHIVTGIPGALYDFGSEMINHAGTTIGNFAHNPIEGTLGMAGSAGSAVANLPIDLLNGATGLGSAIYDKYNGLPYKNAFQIPNVRDLFPDSPGAKYLNEMNQKYPSGGDIASMAALAPFFGGGFATNFAKAAGLGFLGTNDDLDKRFSNTGMAMALMGAPEVAGKTFEATYPNLVNLTTGIKPESTKIAIESVKGNNSLFKNNLEELTRTVSGQINGAKNDYTSQIMDKLNPDEYFTSQYKNLGKSAKDFADKQITPDDLYNQIYRNYAEKIQESGTKLKDELGKNVRAQVDLLKHDAPVPYKDIMRIIDETVEEAGKGSRINPTKDRAKGITEFIKGQLNKEVLNSAAEQLGMTVEELHSWMYQDGLSLDDLGVNPDNLTIDRVGLHNLKEDLQHQAKHNSAYKPALGIARKLGSKFNSILKENTDYADAMDKFSTLNKFYEDHPWLESSDSIARKLSNVEGDAGTLFDTKNKLKDFEKFLPEDSKFFNDLEKFTNEQAQGQLFKKNLKDNVFYDLSKYDTSNPDVQGAFDKLNSQSPVKFLDELNNLKKLMEEQEQQKADLKDFMKLVPDSVSRRPISIQNQPFEIQDAFETLNNLANNDNKFGENLNNLNALNDFVGKPEKLDFRQAHAGARLAGLTTLGAGGAIATHGVAPLSLLLIDQLMRPSFHKGVIENYGRASKIPSSIAQFGAYQTNKKEK